MEWDEGKKLAEKLLLTKESAHMYAERLTELAVALDFDGWLVNFCFLTCNLHSRMFFLRYNSQA